RARTTPRLSYSLISRRSGTVRRTPPHGEASGVDRATPVPARVVGMARRARRREPRYLARLVGPARRRSSNPARAGRGTAARDPDHRGPDNDDVDPPATGQRGGAGPWSVRSRVRHARQRDAVALARQPAAGRGPAH